MSHCRRPGNPGLRQLQVVRQGYDCTKAMLSGADWQLAVPTPWSTVPVTVFVAGLMTVTSPSRMWPTQTCDPSGVIATLRPRAVRPGDALVGWELP